MKKFIIFFLAIFSLLAFAQEKNSTYFKGNALLLPIGVLNVGLEQQLAPKYTLQGDILISPWKSFAGHEFQYYGISLEGRYYLDEAFRHLYFGLNFSTAKFVLQKWNYWNLTTYTNDDNVVFENTHLYQKGFSFILGITAGYQFNLSDRWNVDLYATAGTSQDLYRGYDRNSGKRYDVAKKLNKSGEILPYRGGIMIAYKLK